MANMSANLCLNETTKTTELAVCLTSCVLSIIGAVTIFSTFVCLPEIRNFTRKLIVCLTVADVLTATGFLVEITQEYMYVGNEEDNDVVCKVQSFLTTFSSLASFLLTLSVAVHIFAKTVIRTSAEKLLVYNLVSWGVPAIILIIASVRDVLGSSGKAGPWCWINGNVENSVMWMFVTGKAWEILTYIITFLTFVLLKLYLHIERDSVVFDVLRQEDRNFMYIWLLLYILRLPGTLKFLLSTLNVCNPDLVTLYKVLSIMQAFGDPAQAFGNSILFCLHDKTVRSGIGAGFRRCQKRMIPTGEVDQSREADPLLTNTCLRTSYIS